ncbi:MAG: SDR family NAD(P)-dependent oxidoreductase [Ruminococcus sp.]|nr:SDR family NAD(P)-dependent oxidoreductase [Ruminococcus sp.]
MKTWLITGCSSGFGRALTETLLTKGHQVAVTARRLASIKDITDKYPETSYGLELDVCDHNAVKRAVASAISQFGRIDVLVNNAGYCLRGAIEECSETEIHRQFDTNFFGAVDMIQEVLPYMRQAKSGAIINFSSVAALQTSEGSGFYGASKAALEGVSDALRKEVSPLGIKVMVVEPGPFATDFYDRSLDINENNISDYSATAGQRKVRIQEPDKVMPWKWGSTYKAAEAIITAIESQETPFRLLLGSYAIDCAESFIADKQAEIQKWRELIVSTDI